MLFYNNILSLCIYTDIASFLLKSGVIKLKTTLLRMIETDNLEAVTFVCENRAISEVR